MKHTTVQSSNITSVAHDPDTSTLEVTFANGGTYRYGNVPASAHAKMMAADSVGQYLHQHIKPNHPATRVG